MSELQEIEDALIRHRDPVVSVPELAGEMDRSDTHIRDKLEKLEYMDRVERKDVGARATAWWSVERVTPPQVPPSDHPDQSALEEAAGAVDAHSAERDEPAPDRWTVEDAVASVDLPGYAPKDEDRQNALAAVLRRLRDQGPTKAQVLQEETHEHHETHYDTPKSWWKNAASPALSELREAGLVELVDRHDGVWAWAGDEDGGRDE